MNQLPNYMQKVLECIKSIKMADAVSDWPLPCYRAEADDRVESRHVQSLKNQLTQIVVPMAGAGSRFAKAGYEDPKPLIPVHGLRMIELVIKNLTPARYRTRFIFVVQKKQIEEYQLDEILETASPGCAVVAIDGLTEGAAVTVLAAAKELDFYEPMVIANCDQYIDASMDAFLDHWDACGAQGSIMTMTANDPKWSFVERANDMTVTRVVEKEVVSDEATVGIYGFKEAGFFVDGAGRMLLADDRVNKEFYVAPVYNQLINAWRSRKPQQKFDICTFNIGAERAGMYGLGIPDDLEYFKTLDLAKKACAD